MEFKAPGTGKWRNLDTGRELANRPRGAQDFWFVREPRIAGSRATLTRYFDSIGEPLPQLYEQPPTAPQPPAVTTGNPRLIPLKPVRRDVDELAAMVQRITLAALPRHAVTDAIRGAASQVLRLSSGDIRRVPRDKLASLERFTLNGLEGEMAILEVLDGDTYDIAFVIPMKTATAFGPMIREEYIVMRDVFRLYGIDAAEKNTVQGQLATLLAKKYVDEEKGYMRGRIMGWDKYGRAIIELFTAGGESLAEILIKHEHPRYGKIAVPYHGATKDDYMKQLPKYQIRNGVLIDNTGTPFPIEDLARELVPIRG